MAGRVVTIKLRSRQGQADLEVEVQRAHPPAKFLAVSVERAEEAPGAPPEIGPIELIDEAALYGFLRRVAKEGGKQRARILEPRLVRLRELLGASPYEDPIEVDLDG